MLSAQDAAARLEQWLRAAPGGYMHPDLHIAVDEKRGLHWKAGANIPADTKIITTPHNLALSYLNALVDDAYPVFKQQREQFTVEAIGFFYLMLQHINRATSFWGPYLDTLPSFDSMTTPLWFDEETTSSWLQGTDVLYTMTQRKAIYQDYYTKGKAILGHAGVDTTQFSWNYFVWSITIFTSRSFSSKSIAPDSSKYWTTYKTGRDGQRQTVLLDMSRTFAADLDFSVLFPAIDAGNHNHGTRVHWDYDPGRFSITSLDATRKEEEVFNNYGPKSNAELLQGYGFCVEGNPHDVVLLTIRAPPTSLLQKLRQSHKGYFDSEGDWLPDKATFKLTVLNGSAAADCLAALPDALLELLLIVIRHEQGFDDDTAGSTLKIQARYHLHLARVLSEVLMGKLQRMGDTHLLTPTTLHQKFASSYRAGQIDIITSYLHALQGYPQSSQEGSARLIYLHELLGEDQLSRSQHLQDFMAGIEANTNTADIDQLYLAGWDQDIWVLLICWTVLTERAGSSIPSAVLALIHEHDTASYGPGPDNLEQAADLMSIIEAAAKIVPTSLWSNKAWSADFIDRYGGRLVRNDTFIQPTRLATGVRAQISALCVPMQGSAR